MTKSEFLDALRRALNGNMAAASVDDNIRFYDSYFYTEETKGRSEAEILSELGDPRILARTLIVRLTAQETPTPTKPTRHSSGAHRVRAPRIPSMKKPLPGEAPAPSIRYACPAGS